MVTLLKGRRSLGRPRRRWEDNIEMDFKEAGRERVNCFNPLKTKGRLLYLKTQFIPHSKHFSSRL